MTDHHCHGNEIGENRQLLSLYRRHYGDPCI